MKDETSSSADSPRGTGALSGLRVLDLSRILAGPWCSQIFADLGADVIKVERPLMGDDSRRWEPSFTSQKNDKSVSAYFCATNRGKQSITINMADPEGAEIIRRLAEISDVLIENYKAGDLSRYGLSYDELAKINPRLVYCSITGFGQTGPYRSRTGYDTIIQAMGGLMSLTGERDDKPGGGPQRAGLPYIDIMTGVYAAVATLAALRHRDISGKGQHLDLALLDVQVSSLAYFGLNYLATDRVQQRMGNSNPICHPSGAYTCADVQIVLLVGNNEQFIKFCNVLGMPDLPKEERFSTPGLRVQHNAELDLILAPIFKSAPGAFWSIELEKSGIPCGPINNMADVFADPQVVARGAILKVNHPALGDIPILSSPIRMSDTPAQYHSPPPTLGEHTYKVLERLLDMDPDEINALYKKGIV